MQNIEAIFFDMGGTIRTRIQSHEWREVTMGQLADLVGSNRSPGELYDTLRRRAQDYKRWSHETLRELTEEELWTQWMLPDHPAAEIEPITVQLNLLWRNTEGERPVRPDARDVILELDRRGYLIGLISNTTSRVDSPRLLRALGVADCFETVVLSTVSGKRKPDPAIFWEAARNLGVRPDRSAHVGDRPDRDAAGAKSAGFATAVIIRDPDDAPPETLDTSLAPDHVIQSLSELLSIFPPLAG